MPSHKVRTDAHAAACATFRAVCDRAGADIA
jgi:hypothetical protein